VEALVAAARLHSLQRRLPALTAGEGSLETSFAGYRPVGGDPPTRKAP
jgi:ribosomal protection tetracycline resistance protein